MLLRRLLAGGRSGVEDRFQSPEIAMPHDAFESLLCSEEGRGHPSQHHLAVLPVRDAARLNAHSGVWTLDDVSRGQAAMQRRWDVQPVNGKALFLSFQQTGCC